MFESAELGHKIDKETYEKEVPELREALLNAQFDLAENRYLPCDHTGGRCGRRREG